MRRLLTHFPLLCIERQALADLYGEGSKSAVEGGGLTDNEGMKYTEEEEAVNNHFVENFRAKAAPGIKECQAFLRKYKWVRRSEDSIRNKVRNMIRRK